MQGTFIRGIDFQAVHIKKLSLTCQCISRHSLKKHQIIRLNSNNYKSNQCKNKMIINRI